jgi:hypothetical protein
MANLMVTMAKAMVKSKLGLGKLNGLERFILAQFGLPDRVPTMLAATNIEPDLVDPKYNYKILAESLEANLELFDRVCELIDVDLVMVPIWQGLMNCGTVELGTVFKITEDRVPYSIGYPIQTKEDIQKIKLPEKPTGHLKMYFDIVKEAQRRHPEMLIPTTFDGPWDLAMLLRGDEKLPMDMRLHKDFVKTDDPIRKEKIKKRGDPFVYPAIMELTTHLAIRHIELAKDYGLPLLGVPLVDQYASSPIMSRQDYVKYVLPYIEKVWLHLKKKLTIGYICPSPTVMREILENEPPGINHQIAFTNYVFPTTPEGISLPEYDRPAFELAKAYKKNFAYMVHGKFLRDATESEIEELIKRVCTLAVETGTSIMISITSVPHGSTIEKVNYTYGLVRKYGRY